MAQYYQTLSCICVFSHIRFSKIAEAPTGGGDRVRTDDLLRARQALSQLSHTPIMVGLDGFEPSASRLSGVRSDQAELQAPAFFRDSLQKTVSDLSKPDSDSRVLLFLP